ncbi:hypothetical protein [Streptomyces sp. NPDC059489]|uniref:hypothetical protein n=1 Tax=Streptomyces sp. NPDC059489 TaxID=3346849 RepID=UPI00369F3CED
MAITVADILSPQNIHLGPLLVVAPALTASFGGSRLTAAIGALSIVALVLLSAIRTSVFTSNHESQLIALVVISAFTVIFCRLRERHTAELRQVRSVAEAAQQVVLQPLPERMGTLRIAPPPAPRSACVSVAQSFSGFEYSRHCGLEGPSRHRSVRASA